MPSPSGAKDSLGGKDEDEKGSEQASSKFDDVVVADPTTRKESISAAHPAAPLIGIDSDKGGPTTTETVATNNNDNDDVNKPMSKKQLKKKRKWERAMEVKERRKRQEKEIKLAKAKAQGRDIEQERLEQQQREQDGAGRKLRQEKWEKEKLPLIQKSFQVCVDCSFESQMTPKEINSLSSQIRYCYSINKRSPHPCQLTITSLTEDGPTMANLKNVSGFDDWNLRAFDYSNKSLEEVFSNRLKDVVYLTSDAGESVEHLEDDKIYIIGGIVDRNRLHRAAITRAEALGVKTAKLPIEIHLQKMKATKVLTCNHVFDILLRYREHGRNWEKALLEVLPSRKDAAAAAVTQETDNNQDSDLHDQAAKIRKLKETNKQKQNKLQQLALKYERELESSAAATASTTTTPSLKDQVTALEVELSLLQQAKPSSSADTNHAAVASKSPEMRLREFATEILHSYNDMQGTVDTLEKVLVIEEKKLQKKEIFVQEQGQLLQSLQEQVDIMTKDRHHQQHEPSNLSKAAKRTGATEGGSSEDSRNPKLTKAQRENEWIRQELHYVSKILSPPDVKESDASKDKSQDTATSKRRKRKKQRRNETNSECTSPSLLSDDSSSLLVEDSKTSVEQAVLRLTQRFLDNPQYPYLQVEARNDNLGEHGAGDGDQEQSTRQRSPSGPGSSSVIGLLRHCGVVREHPDNGNWICLNDYRS